MPFDPDQYLAQKSGAGGAPAAPAGAGGFNPDAYLQEKGAATEPTAGEALLPSQLGKSYSGGVGPVNGRQVQFGGNPLNTQFSEFAQDSPALQGPSYEEAQAKLKDILAQGVPESDPRAQQAFMDRSRALHRMNTGGYTSIAAGVPSGVAAKGAVALTRAGENIVKAATGKSAELAAQGVKTEAGDMLERALGDTERAAAPAKALDAVKAKSPNATILDVKAPNPETAKAVADARSALKVAQGRAQLADQTANSVNARLAMADKYAGNSGRSSSAVRELRRAKLAADKEQSEAQAALKEAQEKVTSATTEHKTALKESNKVAQTEKEAQAEAKRAQVLMPKLQRLRAELNAPNAKSNQLLSTSRSVLKTMQEKGFIDEAKYREALGRVNEATRRGESAEKTRQRLETLFRALEYGAVGGGTLGLGLGLAIRRGLFTP